MTLKDLNTPNQPPVQPWSWSNTSPTKENLKETLIPNLDTMRYMEMMTLFNSKTYDEWVVRMKNHTRTFLYFHNLAQLSDEEISPYLEQLQKNYPNLQGSVYLRHHKGKKFISLEPLFPDSGEKKIAQKLADQLKSLLKQKDKNQTSTL